MGKNLQHQQSISLEYGNPGCMRGLFHHLNHPKWHNVKKRLPHKRHSSGSPRAVAGDPENDSIKTTSTEVEGKLDGGTADSEIQAKYSESSSVHRGSMKSKIKALITEEVSKRRGRHRRSSSSPAQLPLERSPSIHHLGESNLDFSVKTIQCGETLNHQCNVPSTVSSLLDPVLPKLRDESIRTETEGELSASVNYLRQSEANDLGKNTVKDQTLLQDSLVYAIEKSKNSSLQKSKLFLDALDLLDIRKEFFLKVLQDPNSSLAHQLRSHKESVTQLRLHKSLSFPVAGSSGGTVATQDSRSSTGENKQLMSIEDPNSTAFASRGDKTSRRTRGTCQSHESPKQMLVTTDSQSDTSPGSKHELKDRRSNKLVMKRFKRLREKVKHAIKENKKERYRIIMDAILHKVPHGRGFAKDKKQKVGVPPGMATEKYVNYRSASSLKSKHVFPFSRDGIRRMRRTSSFNESLERYNRLLELCLCREAQPTSDGPKLRTGVPSAVGTTPASLGRILSLPDLRFYSLSRFEGSPSPSEHSSEMLSNHLLSVGRGSFDEQKGAGLDNHINLETSYKHGSQEPPDVDGTGNDIGGCEKKDDVFHCASVNESIIDSTHVSKFEDDRTETGSTMFSADEDLEPMPEDSYDYDEEFSNLPDEFIVDFATSAENNNIINQEGTLANQNSDNKLQIQVDTRNKIEFNYVRDVLELSGFNGNEFIKKRLSNEQPLDPSLFEEVEEFLQAHPNSSGDTEEGSWNHVLLFDLINEVLLDMCQKSFSYWPVSLTGSCHVRRIPVGYHVLEEVWENILWHLGGMSEAEPSLDGAVSRDLKKGDGWMNIQFEAECVGLELENLIFDDLLGELF